jgi:CheY-like chemotaxis protein
MLPMSTAPLTGRRILLIEDEADIRETTRRRLEALGAKVTTAADGLEGLEQLEGDVRPPDAVLCDLVMPVMNGFEFARRLRAMPRDRQVLLIAVTGFERSFDFTHTWYTGFDWHLVKPLTEEALEALAARLSRAVAPRTGSGAA